MEVYDNFHTAPLDEPPEWEGDDSALKPKQRVNLPMARSLAGIVAQPTLIVPFRPAEPGDEGDHVYALKRMHARFRGGGRLAMLMSKPKNVRRTWSLYTGPGSFYRDFRETRRKLGLSPTPVVYDASAWRKLAPYADDFTLSLLVPKVEAKIDQQMAWLMALYNRRNHVAYSQARPSQLGRADNVTRGDCSGSIAGCCDWARVLPQVDWRWTNTDTQILFGTEVPTLGQAKRGDIVFYGQGSNPAHEAFYLGGGRVWSFGSFPIKLLAVDYRSDRIEIRRFVP